MLSRVDTDQIESSHTDTGLAQSLHPHGHVFRLPHQLADGWEPCWRDTAQIPEGRGGQIAFVAGNSGRRLPSATVLKRFETGLWTSFEVS